MNYNTLSRRMIDAYRRKGQDTYHPRKQDQVDVIKLAEHVKRRSPCMGLFVAGKGFKLMQVTPYLKKI